MRTLLLLLASCSFSAPSVPGAKQACADWFDAVRTKHIDCGMSVSDAEKDYEYWIATCDAVISYNRDMVYGECIPKELMSSCKDAASVTCAAFIQVNQ